MLPFSPGWNHRRSNASPLSSINAQWRFLYDLGYLYTLEQDVWMLYHIIHRHRQ